MSITAVGIVSNAMVLLGGNTIASFDEESSEARIASNLYPTTYKALQTIHRWRFNTKQGSLNKLTSKPLDGYNNAFQLPVDLLYLIRTLQPQKYDVYGTQLHTNYEEVTIDYQYEVSENNLPAYFIQSLEYWLASKFAIPLTGDISKAQFYAQMFEKSLRTAKFNDSTQYPQQEILSNPYVQSRY